MISRILDLMYIQMLRLWATSTVSSPGWLRAGMDPGIGGVLDAIHADRRGPGVRQTPRLPAGTVAARPHHQLSGDHLARR